MTEPAAVNPGMENDMRIHLAAATIAAASMLAVAACDSRDYEAEIATLEGDLQNARSENEQLQTQLSELQAQAEAEPIPTIAVSAIAITNFLIF